MPRRTAGAGPSAPSARAVTELRRARAAAQLLDAVPGPSVPAAPAAAVRHLLAVQAQDLRAARLALRARGAARTAADVDAALRQGTLVVTWLLRGTLHLVHRDDAGWLLALTAPGRLAANRRRLAQEGLDGPTADRAVAVVVEALGESGPLTRPALTERLRRAGVPVEGQAVPHVLLRAALRGLVVLGPVTEAGHAFVLSAEWLGGLPAPRPRARPGPTTAGTDPVPPAGRERDAALAELARRYLRGHAPAAAEDLAAWSGLPLRDARAGLRRARAGQEGAAGDPPAEVPAPRAPARIAPRLLGAFDPWLLDWRDRAHAVAPEHARRVHPGGGVVRAVATDDGMVVGTWTTRRRGGAVEVALEPFAPLGTRVARALDREAAGVARFLDGG